MFRSIFLFFPPSVFSHSYTESCWHTGYTYFLRLTTAVLPLLLCSSTYCLSLGRKPRARAASKQASKTGHWSLIFSSAGRVVSLSSHNGENSSYHHGSSRWAAQRYQVLFTLKNIVLFTRTAVGRRRRPTHRVVISSTQDRV